MPSMNSNSNSSSNNPDDVPTMPADKTLRRRQAKSNKLAISGLFGKYFFNLLICCLLLLNSVQTSQGIRQQNSAVATIIQSQQPQQRICYQCHMPLQCKSGFCFGDFCVKSLVADKYVSKGCENRTNIINNMAKNAIAAEHAILADNQQQQQQLDAYHGPLYARSALSIPNAEGGGDDQQQLRQPNQLKIPIPALGIMPGCVKMNVFGQPNVICYCNDADYCNGAFSISTNTRSELLFLIFLHFLSLLILFPTCQLHLGMNLLQ